MEDSVQPTTNVTIQTETRSKWIYLLFFLVFVIGIVLGLLSYRTYRKRQDAKIAVKSDTSYVYDTIRIPSPPAEPNFITIPYGIPILVKDTVRVRDTLYMYLDKVVKEYRSEYYFAKVSGYNPNLDYIEVYPKTTIITNTERIAPDKNTISIGIDVEYMSTFSLPIYLEYEHMLHKNIGLHAGLQYDLPKKSLGVKAGVSVNFGW